MNRTWATQQFCARSPLCLLGLLGCALFASPVAAQVFDTVINVPQDVVEIVSSRGNSASVGGDGLTTQLNISDGGSVGDFFRADSGSVVNIGGGSVGSQFDANSGSSVNISGGSVDGSFKADFGSVVNISGGSIDDYFAACSSSEVNISGGTVSGFFVADPGSVVNIRGGSVGDVFRAYSGSVINLFGRDFVLDGVSLDDTLTIGDAFTIVDRNVTLTGLLVDGSAFSYDLKGSRFGPNVLDFFESGSTLTVTVVSPVSALGDVDLDGEVTFSDIPPFVEILIAGSYLNEADCNEDGEVNFADIDTFIEILIAG